MDEESVQTASAPSAPPSQTRTSSLKLAVIVIAALLIGGTVLVIGSNVTNRPDSNITPPPVTPTPEVTRASQGTATMAYGLWQGEGTTVRAVNTDGTNDAPIARLPLNIKDINIIDSSHLIYIGGIETAAQDHGKQIILYNLDNQQAQTIYTAPLAWGIDDLIISPDKSSIAIWLAQLAGNGTFVGGRSRVLLSPFRIGSQLNPTVIYDEQVVANQFVHYPLLFDHNNNLYTDNFMPNVGGRWNGGLTDATSKAEILADADYNLDPKLNPQNNLIVYTGYDPSRGPTLSGQGDPAWAEEARNANTVKIFDLTNPAAGERVLVGEPGRFYAEPVWNYNGARVFVKSFAVTRVNNEIQFTDPRMLDIDIQTGDIQVIPENELPSGTFLTVTSDGLLAGEELPSAANLGSNYAAKFSTITLFYGSRYAAPSSGFAATSANASSLTIVSGNVQFIGTAPRAASDPLGIGSALSEQETESLKLASLNFKPEMEERTAQQNDSTIPQGMKCKELWKMHYPDMKYGDFKEQVGRPVHKCKDSPLYIYADEPTEVQVKVTNAEILAADPSYDPEIGWNVVANADGTLLARALDTSYPSYKSYSRIDYTYSSPGDAPTAGYLVARGDLTEKLTWYAEKSGLNGRESADFVKFWSSALPEAPYYFVSHFPEPANIMDLAVTPKPNTFIQVVMYFKPLTESEARNIPTPNPPQFPNVPAREGLTVVDWSGEIALTNFK